MGRGAKNIGLSFAGLMLAVGGILIGVAGGLSMGFSMWAKPADCPKLECPVCEEPSCPSCPECPSCDDDKPQPVTAVKPRTVPIPDEPAPAEEAQAPTTAAVVRIVGDSPDQWWLELNGRKVTGDTYPPGTYTLWAGLNGTAARNMGNLVVAEGQELVEIRCSASWGKCRAAR